MPWNPGPAPLRRLSTFEYVNTVRALLQGDDAGTPGILPADDPPEGFDTGAEYLQVESLWVDKFRLGAEAVAAAVLRKLGSFSTCAAQTEACAQDLADRFGGRAFRRPVKPDEMTWLLATYRAGVSGGTYEEGLRWMLEAMLQSPQFLYHWRTGAPAPGDARLWRLTPYEMAARLSYFLWSGPPDDALVAEARTGRLVTADQVAQQARRMLADPKARQGVGHFFDQWLQIGDVMNVTKLATVYKSFDALRSDLRGEMATFVERTFFDDGKLETLLTAPYTYLDAKLAGLYGLPAPAQTGYVRTEMNPGQRAGILTQGAFLAATSHADQTSPVFRGKFVRVNLLCGAPLSPPPNVNSQPAPFDPKASARVQITARTSGEPCASCHSLINPLGFALENLDPVGRWRTMDGGAPVDASGESIEFPELGRFDGPVDFARKLADSPRVRACMTRQMFRYMAGRAPQDSDADTLTWLQAKLSAAQNDMRELAVTMTATPTFQSRLALQGGAP